MELVCSYRHAVTIANGATVSAAVNLQSRRPLALQMPSAFTGTAVTFQASVDGETYLALYDDAGAAVSVTVAASRYIALDPSTFAGVEFLKIVSGSAEGAAREIGLVVGKILG